MIRKFKEIYDEVDRMYRKTMGIDDKDILGVKTRQFLFDKALDVYTTSAKILYLTDDEGEIL